jgi:hypothetical protein
MSHGCTKRFLSSSSLPDLPHVLARVQVDTLAKNTSTFAMPEPGSELEMFSNPDCFTTMRRIVCRGDEVQATEYDFRCSSVLASILQALLFTEILQRIGHVT